MKNKVFMLLLSGLFVLASCKKEPEPEPESERRFVVMDENGNELQSGVEFNYNTTGNDANLVLLVKNETNETISLKTKLVEVNGTDGSQFEVCIGNCYPSMQLNVAYPLNGNFSVPAGGVTGPNDIHYLNHFTGNCYYTVELYETDASGNKKGEAFRFKYVHQ